MRAAFAGALFGFLWYNCYPAQVFMGDTGSLAIGGIIAVFALLIPQGTAAADPVRNLLRREPVGHFSGRLVQIYEKTLRRGPRVLLMAPLHHHYQKKGYFESKIVVRFWIVQLLLAAITLVTLKIR